MEVFILLVLSYNSIDINKAGQFIIGSGFNDYKQVVDYIIENQAKAVDLYNAYLK
jgi:hypothetical protein